MRNVFQGMHAGERGFDNVNGGSSGVVLGMKSNEGAARMQDIADELKRGGAHGTVRVNTQGDVEYVFAAQDSFREHQAFVFAPAKLSRNDAGFGIVGGVGLRGRVQDAMDQDPERTGRGRLGIANVGAEHAFEGINGGENDFGEFGAMGLGDLERQNVFQFVSDFAEFLKTAGSRIAFEGVDGTANGANEFFVRRILFELQAGFVDDLQLF